MFGLALFFLDKRIFYRLNEMEFFLPILFLA